MIDHKNIDIAEVNNYLKGTLYEHLGMEVVEIGAEHVKMTMPVDKRTLQPMQILNGGASLALAESVGSLAGNLSVYPHKTCLGLDISGRHLKSVSSGIVTAIAKPKRLGSKTQLWDIEIKDEENSLVCVSQLTLMVMDKPAQKA